MSRREGGAGLEDGYNGLMPDSAAKLSPVPSPPVMEAFSASASKATIKASIDEYAKQAAVWIEGLAGVRAAYAETAAGAASLGIGAAENLQKLSDFIEEVSSDISKSDLALRQSEFESKKLIQNLRRADLRAFTQTQHAKLFAAWIDQHNAKVDLYYYLLVLRSEYDPDARGAPALSSPDEIEAYFKEQMKA